MIESMQSIFRAMKTRSMAPCLIFIITLCAIASSACGSTALPTPRERLAPAETPAPILRLATTTPGPFGPLGGRTPPVTRVPTPTGTPRGIKVSGGVLIKGEGSMCHLMLSFADSCTGKNTFSGLPAPEDFVVIVDTDGNVLSGTAHLSMTAGQDYTITGHDCTTHLVGSGSIEFTARDTSGGSGTVTFVGVAISKGEASDPTVCAEGAGSMAGSAMEPVEDTRLELYAFKPQVGSTGTCRFSAFDQLPGIMMPFNYTCIYTIQEVKQ